MKKVFLKITECCSKEWEKVLEKPTQEEYYCACCKKQVSYSGEKITKLNK